MKSKLTSSLVLQLVLLLGAPLSLSSAYAQDASTTDATTAPAVEAAPTDAAPVDANGLPVDPAAESTAFDSTVTTESSAASDDAANAATAAEASTAGHNQFGLKELWEQGDVIAKGTLIIMIIMSAATWYVLVTKLIQQQVLLSQAKSTRKFWEGKDLADGLKTFKEGTAFRAVAEEGVLAAKQHAARAGEKVDLSDWVAHQLQRAVDQVSGQLQTGLSVLATVGSTSPFVGLFGTVWGIYHALIAIGISGQASIDKVAGPVGEALIMTAIGLGVAVPAVLAYNWLVRRNKVIVDSLRNFAGDIHANVAMGVRGGN